MPDNPALNIPVIDATIAPEPHSPPAGDWQDDDGRALDSYFESGETNALLRALVQATQDSIKVPKASRLVARTFTLTTTSSISVPSINALTEDENRTSLVIQTQADATKAGVYIGEQSFAVHDGPDTVGRVTAAFYLSPNAQLVIPDYTGPLWLGVGDLTGKLCRVDVLAVTF